MTQPKTNSISPPSTAARRSRQTMDPEVPVRYIRENFQPEDRIAVVLVEKETHHVTQRVATAEKTASPQFQAWLRHSNASHREIYIGMNPVRADSRSRTKADMCKTCARAR